MTPSLTTSFPSAGCPFMPSGGKLEAVDIHHIEQDSYQEYKPSAIKTTAYGTGCSETQCHSSMMSKWNEPSVHDPLPPIQVIKEAREFLEEFYNDLGTEPDRKQTFEHRMANIVEDVTAQGYYYQTFTELEYGVRLAWRNSSRCIMRAQWRNIRVIDCRGDEYATSKGIFDNCVNHLRTAITDIPSDTPDKPSNKMISSQMTVFKQLLPGQTTGLRIWNGQLVRFAAYKQPDGTILGDPAQLELTEYCQKLGWCKPVESRTAFDVLPLITQGAEEAPYIGELPEDAAALVDITHPFYPGFKDLGVKWHAIPAISNFTITIGGCLYPCCPFNGWYLSTEIAARNFGDENRYNLLPRVAKEVMGLDTSSKRNQWRDRAAIEINTAVLHSFDIAGVTITDQHSASDSFVAHHSNEIKKRGYIPADWIWIVPPIGGSTNSVFHQEMVNFFLKPNFLAPGHSIPELYNRGVQKKWINLAIDTSCSSKSSGDGTPVSNKKVTIFYATETGTAESLAERLKKDLSVRGVQVTLNSLEGYDLKHFLETVGKNTVDHRSTVVIVTSTFGTGEPPVTAAKFARSLYEAIKDIQSLSYEEAQGLKTIQFAVFGCCNHNYVKFNAAVKQFHEQLSILGAEPIAGIEIGEGDELKDQNGIFKDWSKRLIARILGIEVPINGPAAEPMLTRKSLEIEYEVTLSTEPLGKAQVTQATYKKNSYTARLLAYKELVKPKAPGLPVDKKDSTRLFKFDISSFHSGSADVYKYREGDHLTVFPENPAGLSNLLISEIFELEEPGRYVKITPTSDDSYPLPDFLTSGLHTLGEILNTYLELTAAPSHKLVQAALAYSTAQHDTAEYQTLKRLATNRDRYDKWVRAQTPSQYDFFKKFPSVHIPIQVYIRLAPKMQARFYSISSSPLAHPDEVHITVTTFHFKNANGVTKDGLCTSWLWQRCKALDRSLKKDPVIACIYIRESLSCRMYKGVKMTYPIIAIAAGTGIAPFRGFWQNRTKAKEEGENNLGPLTIYFGCKGPNHHLYEEEMNKALHDGILEGVHIAYSRYNKPGKIRGYVQDALKANAKEVFDHIYRQKGMIYVCGGVRMAMAVKQTVTDIIEQVR
ncbi:nitric oxide synthase, partial [Jimgerdemannia flammicorona]